MNPFFEKPFTFDRTVRLLITVAICAGLFLLFKRLSSVILPFLVSWLLAYMIYPLVKFFQYKLKLRYRVIAIILSFITIFGTVILLVWVLKPLISYESFEIRALFREFTNNALPLNLDFLPHEWLIAVNNTLQKFELNLLQLSGSEEDFIAVFKQISPRIWSFLTGSLSVLVSLFVIFIIFLYVFFILIDYEKLEEGWVSFIPRRHRHFASTLANDLRAGMNKYFRSQALIAFLVGILFSTGFKIVDFPLGISLGLFMGLLNLVPYLQTIGLFPIILFSLIKAGATNENFFFVLLMPLIVLVIVQLIQDMILVPKIMGHTTGLKPAVILLSLAVWGALLGIIGMIIALPMTTILISYYRKYILRESETRPEDDFINNAASAEK